MAQLRRKLRLAIQLFETTNSNRLKTGDPLSCELYPAGAAIEVIVTMAAGIGVNTDVNCSGRGSLPVGANVRLIRESGGNWADISTTDFIIISIEESAAAEGVFIFKLQNTNAVTTFATAPSDRIVAKREVANQVTIFEDESDGTDLITQPIDVPTDGLVEGYVDERGLDVYLSGATITDDWTAFNVATFSGETGPLRLKAETLTANTTVNVDADTTIALLDTDTAAVSQIEHCAPGRVLVIYPGTTSLQLTTVNTKADNTIFEAVGRTINLDEDEPLMLVGNAASANVAYWSILGTPALIDLNLDDLADVATGGAANGEPLVFNGTTWVPANAIGTAAAPMTSVFVDDNGLVIGATGFTAKITTGNLAGNRIYSFPDVSTVLVGVTGNADISGLKRFREGAGGFKLGDSGFSRIVEFDNSLITALTTRVFKWPDKNGTIAVITDVRQTLESLDDTTITGSEAVGLPLTKFGVTDYKLTQAIGAASATAAIRPTIDQSVGMEIFDPVNAKSHTVEFGDVLVDPAANTIIPMVPGTVCLDAEVARSMSIKFEFDNTSAIKWGLFERLTNDRNGLMFFRVPLPAFINTLAGIQLVRVSHDWLLQGAAGGAVATELNLYTVGFGSIAAGVAVPPGGAAALLSTNFQAPIGATVIASGSTVAFTADGLFLNTDSAVFLGIAVAGNPPAALGELTLMIDYLQFQNTS